MTPRTHRAQIQVVSRAARNAQHLCKCGLANTPPHTHIIGNVRTVALNSLALHSLTHCLSVIPGLIYYRISKQDKGLDWDQIHSFPTFPCFQHEEGTLWNKTVSNVCIKVHKHPELKWDCKNNQLEFLCLQHRRSIKFLADATFERQTNIILGNK